jgi:hypothetical protein
MDAGQGGAGQACGDDFIPEVEGLYRDAAEELFRTLDELKLGRTEALKPLVGQIRDLRAAVQLVMEERAKVAKFRKQDDGVVYHYALDFEAARTEIGRRLACLRDAGASG